MAAASASRCPCSSPATGKRLHGGSFLVVCGLFVVGGTQHCALNTEHPSPFQHNQPQKTATSRTAARPPTSTPTRSRACSSSRRSSRLMSVWADDDDDDIFQNASLSLSLCSRGAAPRVSTARHCLRAPARAQLSGGETCVYAGACLFLAGMRLLHPMGLLRREMFLSIYTDNNKQSRSGPCPKSVRFLPTAATCHESWRRRRRLSVSLFFFERGKISLFARAALHKNQTIPNARTHTHTPQRANLRKEGRDSVFPRLRARGRDDVNHPKTKQTNPRWFSNAARRSSAAGRRRKLSRCTRKRGRTIKLA